MSTNDSSSIFTPSFFILQYMFSNMFANEVFRYIRHIDIGSMNPEHLLQYLGSTFNIHQVIISIVCYFYHRLRFQKCNFFLNSNHKSGHSYIF